MGGEVPKANASSLLPSPPQLNSECFVVSSRGWELDQGKLLRSLDKISCANFSRVQGRKPYYHRGHDNFLKSIQFHN